MLAVLAASLLSPEFGWAIHADHDALAHHESAAPAPADHDHSGGDASHDHRDPHSSLGHVLGHLPPASCAANLWLGEAFPSIPPVQFAALRPSAVPARLDRPPRPALFG